ncbi:hypothetical protein E2P81_ATG00326 [Venturia nashicola]|nr:hypothetical protein E2P81_ATG00326 [Venturia nashicola]
MPGYRRHWHDPYMYQRAQRPVFDYCPWCEIDQVFQSLVRRPVLVVLKKQHGIEVARMWRDIHAQFHIGADLGDWSFSQVPVDLMERIANHMMATSFDPRDIPGAIADMILDLIEELDVQDDLVPLPHHFGGLGGPRPTGWGSKGVGARIYNPPLMLGEPAGNLFNAMGRSGRR